MSPPRGSVRLLVFELARWLAWFPARMLVSRTPPALAYRLVGLMAPAYSLVARRRRGAIAQGFQRMYGGTLSAGELDALVKASFANFLKVSLDKCYYARFDRRSCERNIEYSGLEHIEEGLKAGRGVVLLHGHLGNPHMIMPAIGHLGIRLHQLASRNPPERVEGRCAGAINYLRNKVFQCDTRNKERLPVRFIYTDRFLREPFEVLKSNGVICIGIDGREGRKALEIDFLNHRALFFTGAMRILLKAQPIVLFTVHLRTPDNRHQIIVHAPTKLELTGDPEQDVSRNIAAFARILEGYILQHPEQYADAFCLKEPYLVETDAAPEPREAPRSRRA